MNCFFKGKENIVLPLTHFNENMILEIHKTWGKIFYSLIRTFWVWSSYNIWCKTYTTFQKITTIKHSGVTVVIWDFFAGSRLRCLIIFEGTLNCVFELKILQDILWQSFCDLKMKTTLFMQEKNNQYSSNFSAWQSKMWRFWNENIFSCFKAASHQWILFCVTYNYIHVQGESTLVLLKQKYSHAKQRKCKLPICRSLPPGRCWERKVKEGLSTNKHLNDFVLWWCVHIVHMFRNLIAVELMAILIAFQLQSQKPCKLDIISRSIYHPGGVHSQVGDVWTTHHIGLIQ